MNYLGDRGREGVLEQNSVLTNLVNTGKLVVKNLSSEHHGEPKLTGHMTVLNNNKPHNALRSLKPLKSCANLLIYCEMKGVEINKFAGTGKRSGNEG